MTTRKNRQGIVARQGIEPAPITSDFPTSACVIVLEYNRQRREKKVFFAQDHSRTKGVDAIGDSTPWRAAEDGPSLMVGAPDDPLAPCSGLARGLPAVAIVLV